MSVIEEAKEWLKAMTNGGYCETSDCNKVIEKLIKELEQYQAVVEPQYLYNIVIEPLIVMLHQFENPTNLKMTAAEMTKSVEGGRDRYLVDPIYHAKVDKLASVIISNYTDSLKEKG